MTTLFQAIETCAQCGASSEHTQVGSTNAFGSQDLDTRPPEMMRSTVRFGVQSCPTCGYCAVKISEALPKAAQVLASPAYQNQLYHPDFPSVANYFLCAGLIYEADSEWISAAWCAVHAAWICDDANTLPEADFCRHRAIHFFDTARQNGQTIGRQVGFGEVVMADLLRRSGQFEAAETVCAEGLALNPEDIIRQILEFTQAKALAFDRRRYTVGDVAKG